MDPTPQTQRASVLETRELKVAGMGCDNCVRKLERAFRARDGVKDVHLDGIAGRVTVTFDRTKLGIPELQELVVQSGYRAGAVET
jgi:P-type Cu+ transporter